MKDEPVRKRTYEMIYEVKLKETMGLVMQELIKASAIENQLTGTVKLSNEEKHSEYAVQDDVKLMSNPPHSKSGPTNAASRQPVRQREPRWRRPLRGLSPEVARGIREDQSAEETGPGRVRYQ